MKSKEWIEERIKYWRDKPKLDKPLTIIPNSPIFRLIASELEKVIEK